MPQPPTLQKLLILLWHKRANITAKISLGEADLSVLRGFLPPKGGESKEQNQKIDEVSNHAPENPYKASVEGTKKQTPNFKSNFFRDKPQNIFPPR